VAAFLGGREVRPGLVLERSEPASSGLIADLRSDAGMKWMPTEDLWLSYLRVDARAGDLTYDLAVDASGAGRPSPVAAGLARDLGPSPTGSWWSRVLWGALALGIVLVAVGGLFRRRIGRPAV
jgi:hypothetical protein